MANTLNLGTDGNWATKEGSLLGYNSESNNYKPLPFNFSRASKATVINKDGLIEEVGNAIPRIDFLGNTKGALKLEPSRTNEIAYSNDISDVYWLKSISGSGVAPIVTSNYAISPDGTQNADRIQFDATTSGSNSDRSRIRTTLSLSDATDYTFSFYAKSTDGSDQQIGILFDNSQTVVVTATSEWQRFEDTSSQIGTNSICGLDLRGGTASTSDILVYGVQVEEGSYSTSAIFTSGSAVTRLADVCNNGGNEQVINSTEGVLYFEGSSLFDTPDSDGIIRIENSSDATNEYLDFRYDTTQNRVQIVVRANGNNQTTSGVVISDTTVNNKFALKYKVNDIALWVNGVEEITVSSASVPTGLDNLSFNNIYTKIKDIRVYNIALTDAELTELTS